MGWGEPHEPAVVPLSKREFGCYSELAVAARDFIARGTTANRERLAAAVAELDTIPVS